MSMRPQRDLRPPVPATTFTDRVMSRVRQEPRPSPARVFARSLGHLALRDALAALMAAWRLSFEPATPVPVSARATSAALFLGVVMIVGVGGSLLMGGMLRWLSTDGPVTMPLEPAAVSTPAPLPTPLPLPVVVTSPEPEADPSPSPRPKARKSDRRDAATAGAATTKPSQRSTDDDRKDRAEKRERKTRETPEPKERERERRETPEPRERERDRSEDDG